MDLSSKKMVEKMYSYTSVKLTTQVTTVFHFKKVKK